MPKLKVAIDTTAQPSLLTETEVKSKASQISANNVVDSTRDVQGKVVAIEVDVPEAIDSDVDFDGDIDPMEVHAKDLSLKTGIAQADHFPARHIKDRSFEKAAVGADPIAWGGAQTQDLSGGTLAVSGDVGKACHQQHSLKAVLNPSLGAKVGWEHVATTKNNKIVKVQQFGFSINVPTVPSGVGVVVTVGNSPPGRQFGIDISDGAPS